METETATPKARRERLSQEERKELFDGVVAVIVRDLVRLEEKWVRDSRVVHDRTVHRGELTAALAKALRNVAERLSGWDDQ
jgi:hypothetical protein